MLLLLSTVIIDMDWSGRGESPTGLARQVRPSRRFSADAAHRSPRGKRTPAAEIHIPLAISDKCLTAN